MIQRCEWRYQDPQGQGGFSESFFFKKHKSRPNKNSLPLGLLVVKVVTVDLSRLSSLITVCLIQAKSLLGGIVALQKLFF